MLELKDISRLMDALYITLGQKNHYFTPSDPQDYDYSEEIRKALVYDFLMLILITNKEK